MEGFDWGDHLPTLTGPRVILRAVESSDLPDVLAVFADAEAMGRWHRMDTMADAEDFLEVTNLGFQRRRLFRWGVADAASNRIVGTCSLFFVDWVHRRGELGFAVIPSRWQQGLATEAVRTLVDFAFGKVWLHRVEAFTRPENTRAVRLLERLGFQQEGCLRERYQVAGEAVDAVAYGLLRSEWKDGRISDT